MYNINLGCTEIWKKYAGNEWLSGEFYADDLENVIILS